jgi:hypothetical protein
MAASDIAAVTIDVAAAANHVATIEKARRAAGFEQAAMAVPMAKKEVPSGPSFPWRS